MVDPRSLIFQDTQYDLVDAYHRGPHIQFINCKSSEDLRLFTRPWGPLYLVETPGAEERKLGIAIRRVTEMHAHRRWRMRLRAWWTPADARRGASSPHRILECRDRARRNEQYVSAR